mgnify:CR=1 FL=1
MKSRKGTAPPQSAPTISPPAPAKPSGKAAQQLSGPQPSAPSKAQAAPAPAAPVKASKAPAAPAVAAPVAASAPQAQRSAPPQPASGPTKPVPFNAMPRAAARPAPKPVNEPVKGLPQIKPVIPQPSAAALRSVPRSVLQEDAAKEAGAAVGRLAPKAAPPAPAQTPASARQLAQEPSAAPVRAETPLAGKKPLGRPRKAAALAPADVADILQANLPDTRPAAPPVPAQQAIGEARAAQVQRQLAPVQRQPAALPQTPAASPPQVRPTAIEVGEPVRTFGAPSAPMAAKEHAALCAYSAQVKMLRTDEEIGAAVRALGAEDASILRQVDRLRRLGGHSRTLCASDDAAVDRLTKAGLVVVLPWNGPKPPSPACYAELTPAGTAVLQHLGPQPAKEAQREEAQTVATLQRYAQPPRLPGNRPAKPAK